MQSEYAPEFTGVGNCCVRPAIAVYGLQLLCTAFSCCVRTAVAVKGLQLLCTNCSCCERPAVAVYGLQVLQCQTVSGEL
jgi:hypothetical protein